MILGGNGTSEGLPLLRYSAMSTLPGRWALANHLMFIAAGKLLFRTDTENLPGRRFLVFAVSWLSLAGVSVVRALTHLSPSNARSAISLLLAATSSLLFAATARVTYSKPLTVIHSSDTPNHLITSGPYSLVRHPFYTSYLANFAATAVASSSAMPSCAFVGAIWIY